MKAEGIIFDKDGTVLNFTEFWLPVAEGAAEYVLRAVGADMELREDMLRTAGAYDGVRGMLCYGTCGDIADAFREVLAEAGYYIAYKDIREIASRGFVESAKRGRILPTCDDIGLVLGRLRENGAKLFLVTSDEREMTEYCLRALGIYELFDEVFTDDGEHPPKPDPYYIDHISEKYGIDKSGIVMVGDTRTDRDFARNGGVTFVGVALCGEDAKLIEDGAAAVIHDISGLGDAIDEI